MKLGIRSIEKAWEDNKTKDLQREVGTRLLTL